MIVFFYDKTFEGLLTCVFDAYSRKTFPDKILAIGDVAPLFMIQSHDVITDESKANRVWAAIRTKLSKNACNMLTHVWLSEEEGSEELLFRYICKTIDAPASIELNFGDNDVLRIAQIAKQVSKEQHFLKMFIRFQKAADDVFFAPVSPKCNALPLVIEHFVDRFADQKWIIYDIKRRYGYYYDMKTTIEITLEDDEHLLSGKLDESLLAQDEKIFQELWKGYFKSMTIKERINPKLQRQHMPKRFWKLLIEKQ